MAVTTSHQDAAGTNGLRSPAAAQALLLDVVGRHADELLRVARANSLCADDAHDAYQRSLEQFLRHGRRLRRETAAGWLFTVCKREALAVRASRSELVGPQEAPLESIEARNAASPEDQALAAEAVSRSAEALGALKPQQLRALWMRADGRTYAEIQEATGWTYTKVNRLLTEGRRAFLRRCAALEAGTACERWHGVLVALAGGDARPQELTSLRPHLRRCPACQATLRGLYASRAAVATVLPPGIVGLEMLERQGAPDRLESLPVWLTRVYEAVAGPLHERATTGALKLQAAVEATASGKVAMVAASTAALAGGGAAVRQDRALPPPARERAAAPAEHRAAPRRPQAPAAQPPAVRRVVGRTAFLAPPKGAAGPSAPVPSKPSIERAPTPRAGRATVRRSGLGDSARTPPSRPPESRAARAPSPRSPEFQAARAPSPRRPEFRAARTGPSPARREFTRVRATGARRAAPVSVGKLARAPASVVRVAAVAVSAAPAASAALPARAAPVARATPVAAPVHPPRGTEWAAPAGVRPARRTPVSASPPSPAASEFGP